MAGFKNSNELRVEVRYRRGLLVPRVFRGETEIQVKEMTQGNDGLDFSADLGAELEAPVAPIPADEAALGQLTPEEITARHEAALKAKADAAKGTTETETTETPAEPAGNGKAKAGK